MQPNSLVFVAIVGIWAVFFVQYWVRRREHAMTARTVDQLSDAMRVLDASGRQGARVMAYGEETGRETRPAILTTRSTQSESTQAPAARPAMPTRPAAYRARPARPVRGLTFLGGLLATLITAVLAPFGLTSWTVVAGALAITVAALFWLRSCVQAEQRAQSALREYRRAQRRARGEDVPAAVARSTPRAASASPTPDVAASSLDPAAEAVADAAGLATEEFISVEVVSASAESVPAVVAVDEDDIPLTWQPVPVPRPTYTMKVKAAPAPVAPDAAIDADESATAPEAEAGYEPQTRRAVGD